MRTDILVSVVDLFFGGYGSSLFAAQPTFEGEHHGYVLARLALSLGVLSGYRGPSTLSDSLKQLRHNSQARDWKTIMAPIRKLNSRVKAIENIRALVALNLNVAGGLVLNVDSPDPAPQPLNAAVNGPVNAFVNAPVQNSTRKMKELSYQLVAPLFKKTLKEAAKELRVSPTTLQVWCKRNKIPRWPYRLISSMDNMLSNIQECGMDGFLKEKGSSLTISEIEDKKRRFEKNPSEPIEDSILLLRNRMHKVAYHKRQKVVKDNS
ncbi:Protein RKD1 [Carex littledalei]|uniref:Protein RKD1 n=1 Tax=Carex littledalei TaxID=544730 RepID=A0A833RER6_9POAL|nr:Protein RKD1 [Carex littledalei]